MSTNSRGNRSKKGPTKGTGGNGRKSLEGRGNTPRANWGMVVIELSTWT